MLTRCSHKQIDWTWRRLSLPSTRSRWRWDVNVTPTFPWMRLPCILKLGLELCFPLTKWKLGECCKSPRYKTSTVLLWENDKWNRQASKETIYRNLIAGNRFSSSQFSKRTSSWFPSRHTLHHHLHSWNDVTCLVMFHHCFSPVNQYS